jgi:propionyl-CoA carboxylase alpha chain
VTSTGHAVEARLYAEDPAAGFLPVTGTIAEWVPPASDAIWDSGVETGSVIGVEFDPMLAKVVAHAPTRSEAASGLAMSLERARIRGTTTNRDFLVAALRHPAFLSGDTTTDFVDRVGVARSRDPKEDELCAAAVAAAFYAQAERSTEAPVLRSIPSGWRNSVMPAETASFVHRDLEVTVAYRPNRDGSFAVTVLGQEMVVRTRPQGGGWIDLEMGSDGVTTRSRFHVLERGERVWVQGYRGDVTLVVRPRFPEPTRDSDVPGGLVAPMPGKVLSVDVVEGDSVTEGQLLLIVEAMKMEHRVTAPRSGVVGEVRAHAGDQVNGGDLLVVLHD